MLSAETPSTRYDFTYYENGLRKTKQCVQGYQNYEYIYDGTTLVAENFIGLYTLVYIYDVNGAPIGFKYRANGYATDTWDVFWYEKNLLGDIVAVYSATGTKLVSYDYDAWGNFTTTYHNGGASTGAMYNKFTYRGYYYDSDLGLYYLQSRYYDPVICRFINADSALYHSMLGYNMFAYCENNPVNYYDPTGENAEAVRGWAATGWWLTLADGPIPIGDIIYYGTLILLILATAKTKESTKPKTGDDAPDSDTEATTPPSDVQIPEVTYPGDDPTIAPDGYEWTGPDAQGGQRGGYKNTDPGKRDSWHPDLNHPGDIDPHWDYNDVFGHKWRVFPDGIKFVK